MTPETQISEYQALRNSAFLRRGRILAGIMQAALFSCAALSVLITGAIIWVLVTESLPFFQQVPFWDFLTDTEWTPVFTEAHYGILPLLTATFWAAGIAMAVATPLGLILSVYLSEFAKPSVREALKPILEMLAAVPTVVFGYFALLFLTPLAKQFIPGLSGFNLLVPGFVMGMMILPYVVSISEDAMRAVPMSLREGAFAIGMSRVQMAFQVVIPGAFSGVTAAYLLGFSRAVGETMVVAIAAGQNPNLTGDPREGAATITAYIVQMSLGDLPHGSLAYSTIFAAGLVLFVITLFFNLTGFFLRRKFREAY
ncbi:MAG: phosphate ABC transporter permease subunit PstC [Phenylobacterium sp.]|jgi:phosphate transport system permease protein|uniref:phosphate ABC transporter permease subunit PstC n=1 Tax=unclassified Phenylobacterium TaxID=2640670 RepID=UPI0008D3349C|nr:MULTISPECIES: phosphate ABC transporter permease subunit PstC [unclassified Phenylobacterium]MBJ7411107.1 phosphate ABC transporter permease subunit PstC [Phenylobacterium sp.]OHB26714.1 MAG: phosphate ABC transporter permease subunit PstC [Phenylobacterium sp. RIFCSPHIGHO2_01_FULL_69_31]